MEMTWNVSVMSLKHGVNVENRMDPFPSPQKPSGDWGGFGPGPLTKACLARGDALRDPRGWGPHFLPRSGRFGSVRDEPEPFRHGKTSN